MPVSTGSWQAGTLETSPYPAGTDPNGWLVGEIGVSSCATRAIRNMMIPGSQAAGVRFVRRTLIGRLRSDCSRKATCQATHGMRYMKAGRTAHGNTVMESGTATRSVGRRFPKLSVAGG